MGDVVGSIVGTAIEVLLQNLISLCTEEISLIRDYKKDLEQLKKSLIMIQAFLDDAEKQQVTNKAVKIWLKNLEAVAFEADNILDELNYEVLRKEVETGNKLKKKKQGLFSYSTNKLKKKVQGLSFNSTRTMALKIREINKNLKLINEDATSYGLQRQLSAHAPSVGANRLAERETDSYSSTDSIVVGRETYVSRIVEILTSNVPTHDELLFPVLPIVGMGGLGKTTSAKLVFHHEKIKTHFEKRIWVYVSQHFDAKDLFKKILESLTGKKVDLETKDALLTKLQENLEAKRYLLVLDDVWIEETKKWGDFLDMLSSISSVKGNGIIVTTRSEKVASIVRRVHVCIPELSKLSDGDCWSIIKEKAFKKGCTIPSKFKTIGEKIAERCQGLPLAAKVVGGVLRGKSEGEWRSIDETRLSNLGEDGNTVKKILKLSFDNLPSQSLKKCFAFCSIFPKGFDIEREMLIYLWMAEGFLQSDQGNNMETVGEEYFNLLLQTSLLQNPVRRHGEIIYSCKMHDLVHDIAFSILHEAGPVRYVYMKSASDISKEEARNLRSLIIEGQFPENMLSDLRYLRSLVLIGYGEVELPNMDHLIHLRYLDILNTGIEYFPNSIGNLYQLQAIRADNEFKELPETLKNLINLRHLRIFPVNRDKPERKRIGKIPMLGHLPHLKSLYLGFLPDVRSIGSSLDGIHDKGVGKDTTIVFPALERLELSYMSSLTELLTAGEILLNREVAMFPRLEYLSLEDCEYLTISTPSHFPCLKELVIIGMDTSLLLENLLVNLTSLTTVKIHEIQGLVSLPDVFFCNNQNLSYLRISRCNNLTHLSPSFGSSLRTFEIENCLKLEELQMNLHCTNSLEYLMIKYCPNLKSISYNPSGEGHESVQGFTSLLELDISWCRGLAQLPIGLIEFCTSLENVRLFQLPSVTNLAAVIGCLQKMTHLTTLELDLRHIPKLDNNNFPIEIHSLGLHSLTISCRMENWDHVQAQLQQLTTVRTLKLRYLEVEELPAEWLGKLPYLEELFLYNFPKLRSLPSKEAMKHLTKLTIRYAHRLNLQRDDDDSEWHKVSHIANLDIE